MSDLNRPDDWDAPVTIPSVDPPTRILVPFDGSHCAERALAWAARVAGTTGAEVVVVVAFEPPLTTKGRGAAYVEAIRQDLTDEAKGLAEESVAELHGRGVQARGIVVKGDVARAILDTCDDEACELIVIGRHGLTAELRGVTGAMSRFRELLTGGVSEKVVLHASVPVLLVT